MENVCNVHVPLSGIWNNFEIVNVICAAARYKIGHMVEAIYVKITQSLFVKMKAKQDKYHRKALQNIKSYCIRIHVYQFFTAIKQMSPTAMGFVEIHVCILSNDEIENWSLFYHMKNGLRILWCIYGIKMTQRLMEKHYTVCFHPT